MIGAKLSVTDFKLNCDANSLGFSNADNVDPWKGVDIYWKLDVDGLRFGVLGTASFLLNASVELTRLALPSGTDSNKDGLLGRWFLLDMCWRPCFEDTGVVFLMRSSFLEATRAALADLTKFSCLLGDDFSSMLALEWFLKIGGEPLGCFSQDGVISSGVSTSLGLMSSVSPASSSAKGSSWERLTSFIYEYFRDYASLSKI